MIGKQLLHYQILSKLGEGGMGVVYKARDTVLDRMVAIKFLSHDIIANDEVNKRFIIEAKAAAALNHPNIATIYTIEEFDNERFIVMEYIAGRELKDIIAESPPNLRYAIEIAIQIAAGLQAAHKRGIVHRDIKSSNIMITTDGNVKIMDFGLAKIGDSGHLTNANSILGTASYMSPEQVQGKELDHRTDIWSFGVLLYELLTGQLPFQGQYDLGIMYAILHEEPDLSGTYNRRLPHNLENIIRHSLQKDKSKRYRSAKDIINDLNSALESLDTQLGHIYKRPKRTRLPLKDHHIIPVSSNGEKRQITIIISKLSGYDQMVENNEIDKVDAHFEAIARNCALITQKYNGIVNQFSENKIISIYGLPEAKEDDIRRAVTATIELHNFIKQYNQEHDLNIQIKSGVNSGLVVVHDSGDGKRRFRITGEAFQTASQLATIANNGEILTSGKNQRIIKTYFEFEPSEKVLNVKSKNTTSKLFNIKNVTDEPGEFREFEEKNLSTFIGRERELSLLKEILQKALNGEGQFVEIIGEAGIGKSRLLYEFRKYIDIKTTVLQADCVAQNSLTPYATIIALYKKLLDIQSENLNLTQIQSLASQITDIDSKLEKYIPIYFHLLSIETSLYPFPNYLHVDNIESIIAKATTALLTLSALRNPLVIFLEDWHWVDKDTVNVLQQLLEVLPHFPICLVLTRRLKPETKWNNPGRYTQIPLEPLKKSATEVIIQSVLGAQHMPSSLSTLIHEKTGGNPFYIEEFTHTLKEEGLIKIESQEVLLPTPIKEFQLPYTIHSVIRSRMDKLDPETMSVLRLASVIGRDFTEDILYLAIGRSFDLHNFIQRLRDIGLIQQLGLFPKVKYRFNHALTHEVVYESLLKHQKKELHEKVGRCLEKAYGNSANEYAVTLMNHFSNAENWSKAIHYGFIASGNASKLFQYKTVYDILEKVVSWIKLLPKNEKQKNLLIKTLLDLERACEHLGYPKRQYEIIVELERLVNPNSEQLAEVYIRKGDHLTLLGQFEAAEEALNKAIEISRKNKNPTAEAKTLRSKGFLMWNLHKDAEAINILETLIELVSKTGNPAILVQDIFSMFNILSRTGDYTRAKKFVDKALHIFDEVSPRRQIYVMLMAGHYYRDVGDFEKALSYLEKAHDIIKKYEGAKPGYTLISLANIHLKMGNTDTALQYYQQAVEMSKKYQLPSEEAIALQALGCALLTIDKDADAISCLEAAAKLYKQQADTENFTAVTKTLAKAYEKSNRLTEAFAIWEQIYSDSKNNRIKDAALEALKALGQLARKIDESPNRAIQYFSEALSLAKDTQNEHELGNILNSFAILEWQLQHYEAARDYYEQALQLFLKRKDYIHAGFILNSLTATLIKLNRYEEALAKLDDAIAIHQRTNQILLEGHAFAMQGDIFLKTADFKRSQKSYEHSLKLRQEIQDRQGEGWVLFQLAKVYSAQGKAQKSKQYANKAFFISKETRLTPLQEEVSAFLNSLN
jgi:serine/threonine protein kinase/tetratricopeptide (TPR) repeat protein